MRLIQQRRTGGTAPTQPSDRAAAQWTAPETPDRPQPRRHVSRPSALCGKCLRAVGPIWMAGRCPPDPSSGNAVDAALGSARLIEEWPTSSRQRPVGSPQAAVVLPPAPPRTAALTATERDPIHMPPLSFRRGSRTPLGHRVDPYSPAGHRRGRARLSSSCAITNRRNWSSCSLRVVETSQGILPAPQAVLTQRAAA